MATLVLFSCNFFLTNHVVLLQLPSIFICRRSVYILTLVHIFLVLCWSNYIKYIVVMAIYANKIMLYPMLQNKKIYHIKLITYASVRSRIKVFISKTFLIYPILLNNIYGFNRQLLVSYHCQFVAWTGSDRLCTITVGWSHDPAVTYPPHCWVVVWTASNRHFCIK